MATKRKQKLVDGMRGLLSVARHDLVENTRGVKKDVQDLMVAARNTRRAVKDTKLSGLIELTNPDAGAEVLTHYKEEWGAIHSDTVDAAQVSSSCALENTPMSNELKWLLKERWVSVFLRVVFLLRISPLMHS